MPELPEVEAVCGAAHRALQGRRIVSAHVLRRRICAPQSPAQLNRAVAGRRFQAVERRGKNILVHLEGVTVWIHLRMTGTLYAVASPPLCPPSASAYFVLDDGRALVFDDSRGLGVLRAATREGVAGLLGPIGLDALSPDFTSERFIALAGSTRAAMKNFLMDQRRVAGLGNIYAAEALHRAGIDPRRPALQVSRMRLVRLHAAIVRLLEEATDSARRAYRRPGGFSEGEWFRAAVYGREGLPCPRCRRPIRRTLQGGRSTYFCPGCQH